MSAFILILALGVLTRQYLVRLTGLPYTVLMLMLGMITGSITSRHHLESPTIRSWANMSPHVIMWVFLPILVFESAFSTDTHIFSQMKWQIMTLAGPGVLVSSVLTGAFVKVAFQAYHWKWPTCFMFGAILSATDPVAVVALLKELGVSERLGTLIEGESLVNDGTAIVVFDLFFDALEDSPCDPEMPSGRNVVTMLLRLGCLGPVVGCGVGWCATALLSHILNDALNEVSITILAAYASFGVAEGVVGTSGVLSVVSCGMYMSRFGRGAISATVAQGMRDFWRQLGHVANTALFFLAGLIVAVKVLNRRNRDLGDDCVKCHGDDERVLRDAENETNCHSFRLLDIFYLVELYVAVHAIRALVVGIATPVLWRGIYGMTLQQVVVIIYAGLRGAVGLALALIIAEADDFASKLQMQILFQVSGIAVLTLCVNGTTTSALLHHLGLDRKTRAEDQIFEHVAVDVDRDISGEIADIAREKYLADADWHLVWRYLPVLSTDVYWLRVRDAKIVLSDAEKTDLRAWGRVDGKPPKKRLFVSAIEAVCPGLLTNRPGYPVPAILRERWVKYHGDHGAKLPRFATRPHAGNLAFDDIYDAVMTTAAGGVLGPANSVTGEHVEHEDDADVQHSRAADVVFNNKAPLGAEHSAITVSPAFRALATHRAALNNKATVRAVESAPSLRGGDVETKDGEQQPVLRSIKVTTSDEHDEVEILPIPQWERQQPAVIDVTSEARARILWAVHASLQTSFSRGRLSDSGLRLLVENTDVQSDNTERALDGWERLGDTDFARPPLFVWKLLTALAHVHNVPLVTTIRDWLNGFVFRKIAFLFEVALAYITAHSSVKIADIIKGDPATLKALEREIAVQIDLAERAVNDFVAVYPESANAVKTQLAARYMLVRMEHHFHTAREYGKISEREYDQAAHRINTSRLKLDRHPYTEGVPALDQLIGHVPFLCDLPPGDLKALVRDPTVCRSELLAADHVLARHGDARLERRADNSGGRLGWFVIVRGTVEVSWTTGGDAESSSGGLVLTAGSVCCLEEQLLDLPFLATYKTLSMVHAVFFDKKVVCTRARKNDALRRGLWWTVALGALGDYPAYATLSASELATLSRAAKFLEGPENPKLLAKLLTQQRSTYGTTQHLASSASKTVGDQCDASGSSSNLAALDSALDLSDPKATHVDLAPDDVLLVLQGTVSVYSAGANVNADPEPVRTVDAVDLVSIDRNTESGRIRLDACTKAFILPKDPRPSVRDHAMYTAHVGAV